MCPGLPHAHIIVSYGRNLTTEEVDSIVRADLPGEDEPELRAKVLGHMVHGPCGAADPSRQCTDPTTKKCSRLYPKPASDITVVDERGFYVYRRPNTTSAVKKLSNGAERIIRDGDIVPYNAALLLRYDAHINVEIANTVRAVKYLFKYACKGPDRVLSTTVELPMPNLADEISTYENNRMVGASEAMWRIFGFHLQQRSPAVKAVAVHLEHKDWLVFCEDDPAAALERTSELMRYFNRPAHPRFDTLTICEYYERYRESNTPTNSSIPHPDGKRHLIERTRGDIIVRLHWVSYYSSLTPSLGPLRGSVF